jgi:hypothetical protein
LDSTLRRLLAAFDCLIAVGVYQPFERFDAVFEVAAERDIRQLELIGGDYDALLAKATEMLRHFPEVYRTVPDHIRRQMTACCSPPSTSRATRSWAPD